MPAQSIRAQIGTLIIATSLVQLAIGFFGTFFALRVALADFSAFRSGLVLSSYFAGFTVGAYFGNRIIERFGHIRVYAAFAGIVVAATSAMTLTMEPPWWVILRAIIGFGCAGLFVTTESWLNAKAAAEDRGRVFSIYMVGCFAALALGQLLIGQVSIEGAAPFNLVIVLFAVALVLVSMTRAEAPQIVAAKSLPFGLLSREAPVAVAGALLSGFITGAFYALVPAWMQDAEIDPQTIGLFMLTAVLGGLAFQVPVGRLSDRFDRRLVIAVLAGCLIVTAIGILQLPQTLAAILPAAAVFGGLISTIYPVSVAHAHDRMPADSVVAVSGRLILASGFGSVLGPLIGANLIAWYSIDGVFYMMAAAAVLLVAITVGRIVIVAPPERQERTFDILAPQAAPLAHEAAGSAEQAAQT
ncbi:MFS transporter [Pseudorhodoplanes sp.]|uniref:MFS transporter n=1 Tax=Pseudorhodoplanes sp. TaxID=1934341 RepID=UPI0039196A4C